MFAALIVAAVLSQEPSQAQRTTAPKVRVSLSLGSFIGSVWAAPSYRDMVFRFKDEAVGDLYNHGSLWDSQYLLYATPVLGPWMTLAHGGQQAKDDLWLLVTSGALQAIGLSALTYKLFTEKFDPSAPKQAEGLELSISPYVAGRLGVAVTLTGF